MYLPKPNETDFTPPPAGTHLATCYRVIDLGTQLTEFQGQQKKQHKIMISWELPNEPMEDGTPFSVHQRYTFSMSEKANLRHHLEAWRGKPFVDSDFGQGGFQIEKIIGAGCMLNVLHATKNGKTYANITAVMSLPKGTKAAPLINKPAFLSLDEFDQSAFDGLSQGLRDVITKSPEYQTILAKRNGTYNGADTPSEDDYGHNPPGPDLDDEIPF
jgi:hypothetical protein